MKNNKAVKTNVKAEQREKTMKRLIVKSGAKAGFQLWCF
jgi:hypothetical protein